MTAREADVTVCTYPFLLPFFIPTILAASMTAGVEAMPRISPWSAGLHNVHSWGLLAVLLVSLVARRPIERPPAGRAGPAPDGDHSGDS